MDLEDLREFIATPRHDGWRVPGLEFVSLDAPGKLVLRLEVTPNLLNYNRTLHGGVAATLVDVVGSIAIITADRDGRFGVSTDLNVTWLSPVPEGAAIRIETNVLKTGRTLAFVSVDLIRESDGVLAVQGRMTKMLTGPAF